MQYLDESFIRFQSSAKHKKYCNYLPKNNIHQAGKLWLRTNVYNTQPLIISFSFIVCFPLRANLTNENLSTFFTRRKYQFSINSREWIIWCLISRIRVKFSLPYNMWIRNFPASILFQRQNAYRRFVNERTFLVVFFLFAEFFCSRWLFDETFT